MYIYIYIYVIVHCITPLGPGVQGVPRVPRAARVAGAPDRILGFLSMDMLMSPWESFYEYSWRTIHGYLLMDPHSWISMDIHPWTYIHWFLWISIRGYPRIWTAHWSIYRLFGGELGWGGTSVKWERRCPNENSMRTEISCGPRGEQLDWFCFSVRIHIVKTWPIDP